jgi:NAD(P)-dependent dehydrogenase (short-subunit alcohol dehydrogenase family)
MHTDLTGKTALITGASSGLGEHFARVLAQAGARVVLAARRTDRIEQAAAEIRDAGGQALALALDVTDRAALDPLLDRIEQEFGRVDVLINNAGIALEGPTLEMTDDDLDRILDVNTKALWHLARRVADRLAKAGQGGSIVNIASILGFGSSPGLSLYAISKAAVVQMTKALALDLWRHNIRVNAICPGYFRTEINGEFFDSAAGQKAISRMPPRRLGEYHELDGLLLLLASDASSFISGASIPVDGTHSAKLA